MQTPSLNWELNKQTQQDVLPEYISLYPPLSFFILCTPCLLLPALSCLPRAGSCERESNFTLQ